jgi:signal transduction histidine kinase
MFLADVSLTSRLLLMLESSASLHLQVAGVLLAGLAAAMAYGGAATVLRLLLGRGLSFRKTSHVLTYIAVVCCYASVMNLSIGIVGLGLMGWVSEQHPIRQTVTWYVSDAVGGLLLGWAIVVLTDPRAWLLVRIQRGRAVLIFVCTVVLMSTAFFLPTRFMVGPVPVMGFVVLPILLWATLTLEHIGALGVVLLSVLPAVVGTLLGLGPLGDLPVQESLVELQIALASAAITGMFIGAAVSERQDQSRMLLRRQRSLTHQRDAMRRTHRALLDEERAQRLELAVRLHDHVAEMLTLARIYLPRAAVQADPPVSRLMQQAHQRIDEAISQSQQVVQELDPTALEALGLGSALRSFAQRFEQQYQLPLQVDFAASIPRLSPSAEAFLYRSAGELLFNILKHAQATAAGIRLDADAQSVTLTVWDNGRGFQQSRSPRLGGSFGLFSIQEQAATFGGTLQTARDEITRVSVRIPA